MFRGITLKNKAGKSLGSSIFLVNGSFQVNIKLNKAVCFSECSSVCMRVCHIESVVAALQCLMAPLVVSVSVAVQQR